MDEAALHGDTHGVLVEGGELLPFTLSPADVGLNYVDASEIKGGDALENAEILKRVLEGEPGPHRDTVLLNAALAIFADGTAQTVKEGVALAKESIDQGHALKKLETMIAYSKEQEVAK
jgi:anthranilate phosphoribosyltransferase